MPTAAAVISTTSPMSARSHLQAAALPLQLSALSTQTLQQRRCAAAATQASPP